MSGHRVDRAADVDGIDVSSVASRVVTAGCWTCRVDHCSARGGVRTHTLSRVGGFKPPASANSATRAQSVRVPATQLLGDAAQATLPTGAMATGQSAAATSHSSVRNRSAVGGWS